MYVVTREEGSNDSQINPDMRAKFGCSQTVLSKKGCTDRQTKGHCSYNIVEDDATNRNGEYKCSNYLKCSV